MAARFGLFVGQEQRKTGGKAPLVKEAEKITKGHVTVWELDNQGLRIGRKPVFKQFDGKKK
jgi:hypothetical protein